VVRNFIALKNPSPRPGFNPRTLGLMPSTLNVTTEATIELLKYHEIYIRVYIDGFNI
jgi:hypothetical protein